MKFLTDENIAISVIRFLRSKKYDVKDVKEEGLKGSADILLLKLAVQEDRILLTHDKDFANIVNNRNTKHKGIILIRLYDQSPDNVIQKLQMLLLTVDESKIRKSLVVLRESHIELEEAAE